jgi:hypothetical protein
MERIPVEHSASAATCKDLYGLATKGPLREAWWHIARSSKSAVAARYAGVVEHGELCRAFVWREVR